MRRIIIIDDLKENLSVLDKTLSGHGYDIRVFNNPIIALRAIKDNPPDLVLLDINMPQMNGIELCRDLKNHDISKDVPVIFLTAQDDKESKVTAFKNGGVDYITKPFIIEELCARVETHLKISELQKEMKNMNLKLEEKVRDRTNKLFEELEARKEVEQKLRIAFKEVESANNAKSMFLANMSHELRTPMNGIIGMTELLKMEDLNEEQMKLLDFQTEAEMILMNIINELLNLEKIEKDLIEVENKTIDLREILKSVIVKNEYKADKKGLKTTHTIDERIPKEVVGDGDKIEEILNHLLSNAVKFTNEGSIISEAKLLGEYETDLEIEFSVKDTGIGIEEEDREKLFLPFVQGDSSYTKRFQGIGLGLVICKKIVEAMGGEIRYETEKDIGTTFFFKLLFKKSY